MCVHSAKLASEKSPGTPQGTSDTWSTAYLNEGHVQKITRGLAAVSTHLHVSVDTTGLGQA